MRWNLEPQYSNDHVAWMVLGVCGSLLLIGYWVRRLKGDSPSGRCWWAAVRDERGTAIVEFVLVFPILLFLILLMTQVMLLMGSHAFINYAAFAAARTAIVQLPEYDQDHDINRMRIGDEKYEAIHRSAALALIPVSYHVESRGGASVEEIAFVNAIKQYYQNSGQTAPVWADRLVADRLVYAFRHTKVKVSEARRRNGEIVFEEIDGQRVAQRGAIAVEVTHQFALTVPWVNRFFQDERISDRLRVRNIAGRSLLSNAGITDRMAPEPSVPRK